MANGSAPHRDSPPRRPSLLLYGMYDARIPASAPRVRIALLADALERRARLVRADRGRWQRLAALPNVLWQLRRVDAVYVESPTGASMPWDLLALAAARAMRRPVGIYFRDAYQLFRDLYPPGSFRQRLSDLAWRFSIRLLRRLATVPFAPSSGLATALRLRRAVLLPPGTDPRQPDLGAGEQPIVAYVGALNAADGFDRLLDAMALVRAELPAARLLVVSGSTAGSLPDWVDLVAGSRGDLPRLLGAARACVIPRPINRYTDLARPVKLADYLSLGKPVVATAAAETAALLAPSGAGLLVADDAAAIAAGLLSVLRDAALAERLAAAARALAVAPGSTWDDRAAEIVERLT
ncbi:MAG TPA: glycosyltransferase [Candidatus Limnocylindria bacterium]|jgi:glycosyltransferase involved in cell wall biosynthesis